MVGTKGIPAGRLTPDSILEKISEYAIFCSYIPQGFAVGRAFHSPLRADSKPSFCIYERSKGKSKYQFKDFATGETGDCFEFVKKLYGCSFPDALSIISTDFNLGLHVKPVNVRRSQLPVIQVNPPSEATKREYSEIAVRRRDWNGTVDKEYWAQYYLDCGTLTHFQVFPVDYIWLNGKVISYPVKNKPSYAFHLGGAFYKILSPYSSMKWISNCRSRHYLGYDQLPWLGDLLIITKSLKDVMVLYKLGFNAISPQSESDTLDPGIMGTLEKRFKEIVVFYDQDKAGHQGSERICKMYGYSSIFVPHHYGVKDISDFISLKEPGETLKLVQFLINQLT